ncbi:MAG TPA: hypothetical protein VJ773_02030, partial [Gemmatimonadales bacterium]|nr:hypothetical protein [Gemmatimonadales bacterium]
ATAVLGARTDSDDATGAPLPGGPGAVPGGGEAVAAALASFLGRSAQRPPAYSAKKVAGVRSYRRARRGEAVALAPVEVTVHRIELLDWSAPRATFRATVGAGTYLRALARDLGEALGCGAYLETLRREAIGGLRVEDAVAPAGLGPAALLPARVAVAHLPTVALDAEAIVAVGHGRSVEAPEGLEGHAALLAGEELAAVARVEAGWLRPEVVLG